MFWRRRNATHRIYSLGVLIFWLSILHAIHSTEIKNYEISPSVGLPSLPTSRRSQYSLRRTIGNDTEEPLHLYTILNRLNAAATLRTNMLTSIGRILLLSLDEESRITFEEIYEAFRSRHVPSYDYLGLVPGMRGKMPKQQIESVLQLMERISTPYISSYATMCLESLSNGKVNVEVTPPTDLLLGIDNSTQNSLAMDLEELKNVEVPSTFHSAVSTVMNSIADDLIEPDLELVATLMVNLPNFDVTNPEVPESLRYVAKYMKDNSKPGDPVLEYLNREQTSGAEKLVKVVLERMLVSETATSVLREAVGQLLQNFHDLGNEVRLHTWNITELFNIVSPDFYPRSVVTVAKYFQQNLNLLYDLEADLTSHATELQALETVVRIISNNASLPEPVREIAVVLASFVTQKAREEDPRHWIEDVNVKRALEYLDAFRNPCLPEKLTSAAKRLRPYFDDQLPWGYAFGDTRLCGNPYELLVNAMIRLRNIDVSQKLGRAIDDFVYQTQYSGAAGERSILYDRKIIFQRGDTDLVELDVHSLLERLPGVFRDERFIPLLVFVSKPNLVDYLGRGFNMLAHTEPRSLLIELINTALDKPAVKEDQALFKALKVSDYLLEQPTLDNKYSSEELEDIVKALPAIDDDPRYLPIKLLFRKENLLKYIPPSFSLAGLESPLQHVVLVLKTVTLKPIDEHLEKSIVFALTNLEGSQSPARSFNRDDFTYLVSTLLRHEKKVAVAVSKSDIYKSISDWNIVVSGNPEDVLARALSYPVKELLRNRQIYAIVKRAVKILEDQTPRKVDLLKRKILDEMLNYFPDTSDLRPVILLLKEANLATVLKPRLNISFLSEQSPRKALIMVLQNLMASPRLKKETVLIKRVKMALNRVEESVDPPDNSVSSIVTEELLNPLARKYKPLWAKFRVLNGNMTLKYDKMILRDFALRLKNEKTDSQLSRAASLALQEIDNGDSSQGIKDSEILEVLRLLPDNPIFNQLKKLLSLSWVRNILPADFRSSDYPRKDKILRIILSLTKQRPEVIENTELVNAISAAERSSVSWKRDVESLRKIVYDVKDTLYDPIEELLRPESLNKLKLNFHSDSEQSPKQLMVDLLQKLMANPTIKANSQLMPVLDGLQQNVLEFGLDEDLLGTLDDVGIPYKPSLAPVRMFLHTNMTNSRLRHLVGRVSSPKKRFQIIRDFLSIDEHVHADKELLKSVHELVRIKPSLENSLGVTEADIMDIVQALPDEVVRNYPDVNELFRPETLKELPFRSAILDSGQPMKTLLMELSRLPKVSGNPKLTATVAELYEALGDFVHQPVISGYNLRPLLRELNHTRQMNVDHILKIIDPKILSVVLPDDLDDYDETQDDAELLNNILDEVLSQNVSGVDAVVKSHVSSMQRDLTTILTQRRKRIGEQPLSDRDVKEMLKLIRKTAEFEAIRYLIKAKDGSYMMPQSISSRKYPTPLKRLMKILDIVERNSGEKNDLYASVIALKSHLTRQYYFVTERDVEMLMDAINGLSVYHNLVPLRLFLTVENLVKYLPSHIEFGRFESPHQALKAVLQILRKNEKLQANTLLQQSIATATAALQKVGSGKKVANKNATPTTFTELTIYDLRFLLNLDLETSELKYYLSPENLINILPRDFSFASKPTFKSKVLYVLSYLESFRLGPYEQIEKMIQEMKLLKDFPAIDNAAVARLVAAIDENKVGIDFNVIIKYLTVGELVKILPSDYRFKHDVRETLIELSIMVLLSLRESQTREIAAFEIFLIQLESPWLPLIKMRAQVTLTELKSLIAEIPFTTCENIGNLSQDLRPDLVLEMFPDGFDLATFKTRKLKLLAILKVVTHHPGASRFKESVQVAIKCVEKMQDVPKLSNWNIGEILNATYIDKRDVIALLENCRAADLAEYLPITFDNRKVKSTRLRLEVVINYCQKLKHEDPAVDEALNRAKIYAEGLPLADLDRIGLMIMLDEICCCNFTSIKPFKVFAATENLLALLPPTMNLEKEPTFKHKVLALLNVIQNLKEFQSEEMIEALNTAVETAHGFRDVAIVSEKDIEELKQLKVMMLPEVKAFANVFVLSNLIKVLPSSFDINDYNTGETKLTFLIDYALEIPRVKIDNECTEAWRIVYRTLRGQAEKEILDFIEIYSKQDDNLTQLLVYETEHKDHFFNQIWITHDYKYELIDDRVRVVLRYMLRFEKITNFKCLTKSINSLISRLSNGPPTEYEVLDAIDQLPDTNENRDLKIFLRCKDVKKRAKSTLNLTPDHSLKRILLHMLTMPQSPDVDEEIKAAIDIAIPELEKAIRDEEVEEILKELPNSKAHTENLQAVRSYYVLNGPSAIFGPDYHSGSYDQPKMLRKLVNRLLLSPDIDRDKELKTQVKYINEVLKNPTNETSPGQRTTIQDIDITPMLSVLPKIKSDELTFGLLKFFTDPKLPDKIGRAIDPSRFNTQGSLMKEIVDFGLNLDSVKEDQNQQRALKYVRYKTLLTGFAAEPIRLKPLSRHARAKPDLMCLLKAVDYRSANLSNLVPIAKFFETEYDPLIHARGFDHTIHHTRGAYLRALLKHLIANADLQKDLERNAKVLVNFVNLNGPGAEPIDLNEEITLANRVFYNKFSPGSNPQGTRSPDVSAHFRNHPQDPWKKTFTVEPGRRSTYEPSYFQRLMKKENEPSNPFEDERSALRFSVNRILHSNRQTKEARFNDKEPFDPDTATFPPDKVLVDFKTGLVKEPMNTKSDTDSSLLRKPRDLSEFDDTFNEGYKRRGRYYKRVNKKHWSQLPHARLELDIILKEICCCDFTSIKPFIIFKATHNVLELLPQSLNLDEEPTFKHKLLAVLAALRNSEEFQTKEMMIALDTAEDEADALPDTALISEDDIKQLKQLNVMMAPEAEPFLEIFVLHNLIKVLPPSFNIDDYQMEDTKLAYLLEYSMYLVEVKTDDRYADSWRFVYRALRQQAEKEILDFIEIYGRTDEDLTQLLDYVQSHKDEFFKNLWLTHGFELELIDDRVRVVLKYMLQYERITNFEKLTNSIKSLIAIVSDGRPPTEWEILRAIDQLPEDSSETQELKIYLHCKDVINQAKNDLTLTQEHDYEQLLSDMLNMVQLGTANAETSMRRCTREAPMGRPEESVILPVSRTAIKLSKRELRDGVSSAPQLHDEEPFDPETATFSPDKVLVDVKTRMVKGPLKTESDEETYITEEEAAKLGRRKHELVRPLTVSSQDGLPAATDSEYEAIPHTVSKNPGQIDFVSRKLFTRNDTDPSLIREPRDLKDDILIEDAENDRHEDETVKKDSSQSPSVKCYAMPTTILEKDIAIFDVNKVADWFPGSENTATPGPSIEDKTRAFKDARGKRCYAVPTVILETEIVDENESADSLPVPEALTLERSTHHPKLESPGPSIDDESRASEDQKSSGQLADDITIRDSESRGARCYEMPTIILETEIVDENGSADSLPVPEALTLERSTDHPETESPGLLINDESRTSKDEKSSGQLTDDITVEDFKAHVMETRKSPEGRALAKRDTSRDNEHHNTEKIEGSSSPSQLSNSIQDTDAGEQMILQRTSDDGYYEEVPIAAEASDSGDYGNFQQLFPKIETIYVESIRKKRSNDHGVPRVGIGR